MANMATMEVLELLLEVLEVALEVVEAPLAAFKVGSFKGGPLIGFFGLF